MIQKLSTTYSKEHCTCYDEYEDNVLVAVMIEPESGYKLRYMDNENTYDVSGFALININMIEIFDSYTAVDVSLELLPSNIKDGSIILFVDGEYQIDLDEEILRKQRIIEKMRLLKNLKRSDNDE